MKKHLFLTLLLILCGVTMAWAQFAPEAGKKYALKESTTGLYLDIQTLSINEPNANATTNNVSLNAKPCVIYFEAGANGGWKMKNADGGYVCQGGRAWNAVIGTTPYEWTFAEAEGLVTIARADGKFINMDNPSAGQPLYCDKGTGLKFSLLEYDNIRFIIGNGNTGVVQVKDINEQGLTSITAGAGWTLTLEVENPNGASYNQWGTSILATGDSAFPEKNNYTGFQLYLQSASNGQGKLDAVFNGADHVISNVTHTGNFSVVINYDGSSNLEIQSTNASGTKATDHFTLTGLPEFSQFAYGLPQGINIKSMQIEKHVVEMKYAFAIDAPQGKEVVVTYGEESVLVGDVFLKEGLDVERFVANEIPGYTWSIVIDEEEGMISLVYTEAEIVENPQAVVDFVNRIGGKGTAKKFEFVLDPSLNSKQEVFVLGAERNKILIKGSTLSAITTGIGWYLNHYANINIAWNSLNEKTAVGGAYADLSDLPLPAEEETRISDAKYRYYLNYCTFGYSMTSWTWNRWQQEIDWMALHGINMPLQIVGLEEVWRKFLTMEENGKSKYNYTDEEAKAFVAGPAFTAWWGMNNLEGWGGTDPGTLNGAVWAGAGGVQDDAWYVRQQKLATQILSRQRELGIEPVLPGFSGMVPTNFTTKTGVATDANGGKWAGGFQRPRIIDPTASRFAEIAADYYACLTAVMGESKYYSMDPFHEGGSISSGKYAEAYKAIFDAMEEAKEGSQWVIQQWQWDGNQRKSLQAVPAGRLIVLDLFSDGSPAFNGYNGYAPQDAVFCAIPNFGGRSGLMGRLNNVTDNYFTYKAKFASIKGIGTAPEAIEQTPITYDLIYQLPWMGSKPDVKAWVEKYAVARYGVDNAVVKEAWELLRQGVLNYGADAIQGPVEDVWAARPNLNANPASAWGKTLNHAGGTYTKARRQMLIDATYKLLSQKEALALEEGSIYESNYLYDLVEFGGGVMADYAYDLLNGIREAKNANDAAIYAARRDAFLALIEDMDAFKGTNLNFRLGKWTQEARDAAAEITGATTATPDWYEFNNARTILTTWSSPNTNLNDYSYRSWQGLLKDFYLPRWKHYFDNDCAAAEYGYFEWNWAHGMTHAVGQTSVSTTRLTEGQPGYRYSREPEGNTIEEATKLLGKYIIPVVMADGTYYAYRYLANDLTAKVTIIAGTGDEIDLTQYFGALTGSVAGDFIDGDASDLSKIRIKSDAADGSHVGTITLNDGTMLTFAVVINPGYYGVYQINYKNGSSNAPVFIGYNTVEDNAKNVGYKLLATGTYFADAEVDKLFTIVPGGEGYTISAQGKYLKSPNLNGWNHIMFSDEKAEAGVYLFDNTDVADVFKIRSVGNGINYVNDYDNLIFGNDKPDKENLATFTFSQVDEYTLAIPAIGVAALYLPFHVVLPEGVYAYDFTASDIRVEEGEYACYLREVAKAGETLKSGTPVIVKAEPGDYSLAITMQPNNAKGATSGSLLCGTFVKQETEKFILTKQGAFEKAAGINANQCWMEAPAAMTDVQTFVLRWGDPTGIGVNVITLEQPVIYNIAGQRLTAPQQGVNIVNGQKVIVK